MPDPLAVLLLPTRLEEFALADHARDLLRAPRVIALEPPRVSWSRLARLPEAVAPRIALRQARRLKLPGELRVVIVYGPLQALLAVGLLGHHPQAELWYVRQAEAGPETDALAEARLAALDELIAKRAGLQISIDDLAPLPPQRAWFDANEPLWDRLEALGVAEFAD